MPRPPNDVESTATARVPAGSLLVNWIGQAGFVLKTPDNSILCIDPYLSNSVERLSGPAARRLWWPSFAFERFKVDAVVCTHDHIDHTDTDTIPLITAYNPCVRYYGPPSVAAHIAKMGVEGGRITTMEKGVKHSLGEIAFRAVYAKHTKDSIGLILDAARMRIYLTGDTEYCQEIFENKRESPGVLITCINGIYGNLNPEQACELAVKLGVRAVIPMHYGLLPNNTVDPAVFAKLCEAAHVPCHVLTQEKSYLMARNAGGGVSVRLGTD